MYMFVIFTTDNRIGTSYTLRLFYANIAFSIPFARYFKSRLTIFN